MADVVKQSENHHDLLIVGELRSSCFHKAKHVAEQVHEQTQKAVTIEPMMEFQWSIYKEHLKKDKGWLMAWHCDEGVAVFVSGKLMQSLNSFLQWADENTDLLIAEIQEQDYSDVAMQAYTQHINTHKNGFVFMDVSIDGSPVGRLLFELYKDVCPKTCANFVALCTGEKGVTEDDVKLSYVDSIFHRVVPNGWVQGGGSEVEGWWRGYFHRLQFPSILNPASGFGFDICGGSGSKGMSIFGKFFEDECFAVSHDQRGVLGMANEGPNTNSSQFYITLQPTPWMDKHYVAFGRVVEGTEVLEKIDSLTTFNERPRDRCEITNCGLLSTSS